jgi:hypothetical protein
MSVEDDLDTIRDALIVLGGFLPLFSGDKRTVARAEQCLALKYEALDALERTADALDVPAPVRVTTWRPE